MPELAGAGDFQVFHFANEFRADPMDLHSAACFPGVAAGEGLIAAGKRKIATGEGKTAAGEGGRFRCQRPQHGEEVVDLFLGKTGAHQAAGEKDSACGRAPTAFTGIGPED